MTDPTTTRPRPDPDPTNDRRARTIKQGDAALSSVLLRPEDKERFVAAAERVGLLHIDAATLMVDLLDRVTGDERAETPAERIARLASKVGR